MSEKSSTMFDPKSRKVLYEFWEFLPKIKVVVDYDDNFFKHKIRKLIFTILGTGIKEVFDGKEVVRKALNAQEIFQIVVELREKRKKQLLKLGKDFEPSLHSLYFHLQKMEEAGFIRTVTILREGRYNIAYYSRSAQVVFFKENYVEDEETKNSFIAMSKIVPLINAKLKPEKIMEFYEKYVDLANEVLEDVYKKIAQYQEYLDEVEVDPFELQKFFLLIRSANPKLSALYNEMIQYIGNDI
jgi:hypothetical protein